MKGVTTHSTTGACSDKVVRDEALIYNLCLFHVFICALLLFSRTLPSHRDKELSCCFGGQQVWTGSERYHKVVNTRWGRQGRTSWIMPESPRLCSRWTKKAARTGMELSDSWVYSKFKLKGISKGEKFWMRTGVFAAGSITVKINVCSVVIVKNKNK